MESNGHTDNASALPIDSSNPAQAPPDQSQIALPSPQPPSQPPNQAEKESPRKKSVATALASNIPPTRKVSLVAKPPTSQTKSNASSRNLAGGQSTTNVNGTGASTAKLKASAALLDKGTAGLISSKSKSVPSPGANNTLATTSSPTDALNKLSTPIPITLNIPSEGVLPLFITGPTQDMFKIKASEDLTREKPFKLIPKADLLSDIHVRIAISDWYPAKKEITEYPGDEILVHWDPDFKLGQNFFICVSTGATDSILNPIIMPVMGKENTVPNAAPIQRKWTSLGSELEVEEEWAKPGRELIQLQLSKKRKFFGAPCHFADRGAAEAYTDIRSIKDPVLDIPRSELSKGVQAIPPVKTEAAQTSWFRPQNFAAQYEPLLLPPSECDKLVNTDEMIQFVKSVGTRFEKALLQNDMFDIFADDYRELGDDDFALEQGGSQAHLQEYQSFTDLRHSKDRTISCISWHPTQKGIVAVSCEQPVTLEQRIETGPNSKSRQALVLIWSFHDPIHPQLILEAPDDVHCFAFHPYDPSIVVAGCINGQVVIWDLTDFQDRLRVGRRAKSAGAGDGDEGSSYTTSTSGNASGKVPEIPICHWAAASSIESGHRMAVGDLMWFPKGMELNSHTGEILEAPDGSHRQLITCALDGQVLFWDIRTRKDFRGMDLVWKPFWRITLAPSDGAFEYGLNKIAIRGPVREKSDVKGSQNLLSAPSDKIVEKAISKFYCATEEGDLLYADWFSDKSDEKAPASRLESSVPAHPGCVSDLQRSPFFPDILLSVGSWTFCIWKEKVTTGPLLTCAPSSTYLISGRWSPTRPGIFFITRADGAIEVWDLMDRSHVPSLVQTVCSAAIASMEVHQYGGRSTERRQFIAAGDDEGSLHILEVPRGLSKPARNEQQSVGSFFDREVKRLQYVQERKRMRAAEKAKFDLESMGKKAAEVAADSPECASPAAEPSSNGNATGSADGIPSAKEKEGDAIEKEYQEMERQFFESNSIVIE
ncbi:hypothetical protein SeLEV6574_g00261 [Synchytrium endobioticum]|uniref:WD repeat-containing protein 63 n=1 Tax=Synchytrium endobioticum TaxID=286115 RepID=A0A507DJT3_9FUNG|nr:hypothetical protein SeLEV6574_g00261 [Synchytrium endobioticum]